MRLEIEIGASEAGRGYQWQIVVITSQNRRDHWFTNNWYYGTATSARAAATRWLRRLRAGLTTAPAPPGEE